MTFIILHNFRQVETRKIMATLQPLPRAGEKEDIAKMVAFLIDDEQAGFITGSFMLVDGGCTTAGGFNAPKGSPFHEILCHSFEK